MRERWFSSYCLFCLAILIIVPHNKTTTTIESWWHTIATCTWARVALRTPVWLTLMSEVDWGLADPDWASLGSSSFWTMGMSQNQATMTGGGDYSTHFSCSLNQWSSQTWSSYGDSWGFLSHRLTFTLFCWLKQVTWTSLKSRWGAGK